MLISSAPYLNASSTALVSPPIAPGAAGIAFAVLLKRGAGAACTMPPGAKKVSRAAICGWKRASENVKTGATQASLSAKTAAHSSRVLRARLAPLPLRQHRVDRTHHRGDTIHHGGAHHLSLAGDPTLDHRAEDAKGPAITPLPEASPRVRPLRNPSWTAARPHRATAAPFPFYAACRRLCRGFRTRD